MSGTVASSDHDLIGTSAGSVGFNSANGDLIGINPLLEPLGTFGGPTETMLPEFSSPVLASGDDAARANVSGLVALYEGEGNANDRIGGNNGSPQGNVAFAAGKVGRPSVSTAAVM